MKIGIDVGYYNIDEQRAPCSPLAGASMNVDYRGRLSLCCNLSGFRGAAEEPDVVADLNVESFSSALTKLRALAAAQLQKRKQKRSCPCVARRHARSLHRFALPVLSAKLWQDPLAQWRITDLRGWLPVDAVVVDGRPGLSWMNMAGVESCRTVFSTNR